ncbi:MAG: methionine--tRNA ligase [Candidatus Omnitrophica bacterium]|nr:methionine--tRNA ligase [Candidatus Omnitrophota bacterium]
MPNKFYITTPLYYVNASPHIGHSYTNIIVDTIARFKRLKGFEVFFLTGTDEHGLKVRQASEANNLPPKEFVDNLVPRFKELWQMLNISYDDFIRTTEDRHKEVVKRVLSLLYENSDIYLGDYKGFYCTPCETFWTRTQLKEENCPECKRSLEEISEKNYFFKLSKYQSWLIDYIKEHPKFIQPSFRTNEILSFLEQPLQDLCISRPTSRLSWGIPVPFSAEHVTYVWFDALINYISGAGYINDTKKFSKLWPADIHMIGKDILRPHSIYWPIMLKALGLDMPKTVFAHGWWLQEGEKMSKSRGNITDPVYLVDKYGADAYRYFLLREVSLGMDGVFSEKQIEKRINSDLANDLGNLLNRTLGMIELYFNRKIPNPKRELDQDIKLREKTIGLWKTYEELMEDLKLSEGLSYIWELINFSNKYIEDSKPWELARQKDKRLDTVMYNLVEALRIVGIAISPFMPKTAEDIFSQLGLAKDFKFLDLKECGLSKPDTTINKGKPIFPRIE